MKNLYQNKTELDIIKMVTNSKGSTYGSFAMSTSSSSVPLGTVIVSIMHSNRIFSSRSSLSREISSQRDVIIPRCAALSSSLSSVIIPSNASLEEKMQTILFFKHLRLVNHCQNFLIVSVYNVMLLCQNIINPSVSKSYMYVYINRDSIFMLW